MKVVVTGGSGQLGSLVLARLAASRKVERVVSLDLVPPIVASKKIDWKIADVRDPGLERHFEGADALVHMAFIVARRAPVETMRAVNVEASKKLFAHAVREKLGAIVYSSSSAAYGLDGPHSSPIREDEPRRPTPWLAYADNKWEVEEHLDQLEARDPGLRIVRLRPTLLMGRRMDETAASLLRRGLMPKAGSGRIPVVWDEDVADAVVLALLGDVRGAFNLSADEAKPVEELAEAGGLRVLSVPKFARSGWSKLSPLLDRSGSWGDPAWLAASDLDMEVSSERALSELGWKRSCDTSGDVMRRFAAEVPRKTDARITAFLKLVDLSGRRIPEAQLTEEARRVKAEVHLNLTGPGGGDFVFSMNEGRVRVRRGVPRPPDTVLTMKAEALIEMLAGRLDLSAARMTGKVRMQGDPQGSFLFGALVTGFRASAGQPGVRGFAMGKLARWFEGGT